MTYSCENFEKYLHEQIPISKAMGIHVEHATCDQVTLKASFAKNINHKKTVFGGSLNAIATLACWSVLHLNLTNLYGDHRVQVVIASNETSYLSPLNNDIVATSLLPDPELWNRFITTLQKRGKARIKLKSKICDDGQPCVAFSGIFVAILIGNSSYR